MHVGRRQLLEEPERMMPLLTCPRWKTCRAIAPQLQLSAIQVRAIPSTMIQYLVSTTQSELIGLRSS